MMTYTFKIPWYSVENRATHDSISSVNGAPLQDMEVFFFFYHVELLELYHSKSMAYLEIPAVYINPNINIHARL